ncbi:hypothetical protein AYR66_09990 [Noviherbaspirillum denitrificans]|uniref:Ku domain-containing protein n=2 Tax=Noviherbaspirillum denitrificans TaxID=1968433 RepID=A0A254TAY2_9BURK|nr:hypothetical protein AYR66_09990 [Noviherbaspirillum denitrificans]
MNEERRFVNFPDKELYQPPRPTHAVDILAFVEAREIPPDCFGTPYTLAPAPGGERIYALLHETLRRSGQIGIAYVVIQARQHLAAVVPQDQCLVLNTLHWSHERGSCNAMQPEEDTPCHEYARQLALLAPPIHAGDHRNPFQPARKALEENNMKAKKSECIIVEELEGLLDEDELIDDDYLASILSRRGHPADAHALRRAQAPERHRRIGVRRKRY